jgi:hypothetical protein
VALFVASDVRAAEQAILNAPFEERGWERATLAIAEATRSSAAQLIGFGGPLLLPLNVVAGDITGPTGHLCNAHLYGPCNWRINSVGPAMSVQHEAHYRAYAAVNDTADYDDAVADVDLPYGCQSALAVDSGRLIGFSLLRRRRDGPCDDLVLQRFTFLRHQLWRSIRAQLAMDGETAQLMLGDIEALQCATLLLDRHCVLAEMTPAAETLFDEGGPLRLFGLSVHLTVTHYDRQFQRLLAALLGDEGPQIGEIRVAGNRGPDVAQWRLIATRLPAREHGLGFEPTIAVTLRPVAARELQPAMRKGYDKEAHAME